jgi:uncharacterized tellurite resistance protein B-like protein
MYAVVKAFLERLGEGQEINFTESEYRLAMAVLLFRVVTIDGEVKETEIAVYRTLLQEKLNVSPYELDLFEATVRRESEKEASLFPFTTIVKKMPLDTRRQILNMMKEISLSDNELHEFEINLVARTAELLDLPIE